MKLRQDYIWKLPPHLSSASAAEDLTGNQELIPRWSPESGLHSQERDAVGREGQRGLTLVTPKALLSFVWKRSNRSLHLWSLLESEMPWFAPPPFDDAVLSEVEYPFSRYYYCFPKACSCTVCTHHWNKSNYLWASELWHTRCWPASQSELPTPPASQINKTHTTQDHILSPLLMSCLPPVNTSEQRAGVHSQTYLGKACLPLQALNINAAAKVPSCYAKHPL